MHVMLAHPTPIYSVHFLFLTAASTDQRGWTPFSPGPESSPLLPLRKGTGAFLVVSLEERLLFPLPLQLSQAKTYNTKPRIAPLDKRRLRKTSPLSDRVLGREDGSIGKLLTLQGG